MVRGLNRRALGSSHRPARIGGGRKSKPDLTITPNYKIGGEIDGYNARILQRPDRYRNTTRLTYQQVGLDLTYDVTKLLHLPSWAGSVSVSGFLYFSDGLGNAEDDHTLQDEFYGGMSVGWTWGG